MGDFGRDRVQSHIILIYAGVYILVENGYLFPPPPSEIYIFSPKKQRDFRAIIDFGENRYWKLLNSIFSFTGIVYLYFFRK